MKSIFKRLFLFTLMALIISIDKVPSVLAAPAVLAKTSRAAQEAPASLKFTSSGHILRFSNTGMFLASGIHALRVDFVNANPVSPQADASISASNTIEDGTTTTGKIAPLSQVTYVNLWQGISLRYSAGGIYTSTYHLSAGADVKNIQLRYNTPVALKENGTLVSTFESGTLIESAPIAWQIIAGKYIAVDVAFQVRDQTIGFVLGSYNPSYPLTIDPVAEWNTFIGGVGWDVGKGMALDGDGNIYVTGSSSAAWGSPVQAYNSAFPYNIYIAKLDANGTLIWNTFLGGGVGNAILVDSVGNLYICGEGDAFIAKLNPTSGALIWRTFLGGVGHNSATAITSDASGNVYAAGFSNATWGNPVRAHAGDYDSFIARLNANGTLIWNTFLGGGKVDVAHSLQSDGNGNINIVGFSGGTWGTPVRAFIKKNDIFAAKLNPNGELIWNTFLGGNGDDTGEGISLDSNGNIYLTGISDTTWGNPLRAHGINVAGANYDAFAVKLNSNGTLIWNTFLGGEKSDFGKAILVDSDSNVYVGGSGNSVWGNPSRPYNSGNDAFTAKLNADGMLIWNAFVGAAWYEDVNAIAIDGNGTLYLGGMSNKNWGNPVEAHHGGDYDAFVAKFNPPISIMLNSIGADDGWALESSESSNIGGTFLNVGAIMLGDDANKHQYRGILSFNTGAGIPDNATVTGVMLNFKQKGIIGKVNPVSTFQGFMVDMKSGFIDTLSALQITDFETNIAGPYGPFITIPFNNIYHIDLTNGKTNINRLSANNGLTQIRLRFKLDDNNDSIANTLYLYSGNAIQAENRPQLLITYIVP